MEKQMIDTTHIDLLSLVRVPMQHISGNEYAGPCPFCDGGNDRFRIWIAGSDRHAPGYWCRQCEKRGRDAIDFIRQRDGVGFGEALRTLNLDSNKPNERVEPDPQPPRTVEAPPTMWQDRMSRFIAWSRDAQQCYHVDDYMHHCKPMQWLQWRGLSLDTLNAARIGYNPHDWRLYRTACGLEAEAEKTKLTLPRGIVFPYIVDGTIWKLSIRKPITGHGKYHHVAGSANAPYGVDWLEPGKPAILVEGPMDALSVWQAAGDLITPLAVGTTGAQRFTWLCRIARSGRVLIAMDADGKGERAVSYWQDALGEQARVWQPLWGDPSQMLQDGADLRQWIAGGLEERTQVQGVDLTARNDNTDHHTLVTHIRHLWRAERDAGHYNPSDELATDLDASSFDMLTALAETIQARLRKAQSTPAVSTTPPHLADGWQWRHYRTGCYQAHHAEHGETSIWSELQRCLNDVQRRTPKAVHVSKRVPTSGPMFDELFEERG